MTGTPKRVSTIPHHLSAGLDRLATGLFVAWKFLSIGIRHADIGLGMEVETWHHRAP
jgi:hypothetical protein